MPIARVLAALALASLPWQVGAQSHSRTLSTAATAPTPPALLDIADAVADGNHDTVPDMKGRRVRVRGTVISPTGVLRSHGLQVFIDDGTAGMGLYQPSLDTPLAAGDRVEASGVVSQYKGTVQLENVQLKRFGSGALPAPHEVGGAEVNGWTYMGRRIHLDGVARDVTLGTFGLLQMTATDGHPVTVFVPESVTGTLDWKRFAAGTHVDVTGVLSIHKPSWPYDSGFQVVLTRATDLRVLSPPGPAWRFWALRVVGIAILLWVLVLLGRRGWLAHRRARERELRSLSALSDAFAHADLGEEQLARHACDILTGYGIVDAALVHVFDERGCLQQLAAAAADPALGNALHLDGGLEGEGAANLSPQQHIQARVTRHGLSLLAVHPLATATGTRGFLAALSPRHRRSSAMQERTLLAAVKLLAMALENSHIQQRARVERQALQKQVITDELTRLYNRRFLDEYLRVQMPLAERNGGGLAFLTIDIDHFKQVNDTYGHAVGDRVLVGVANLIRAAARSADLPVRIGGEEFLVVVAKQDIAGAMIFAERLRARVQGHAFEGAAGGPAIRVTISVGVSLFGPHGDNTGMLMQASDQAMYESKRTGRNRVSLAHATDQPLRPSVEPAVLP